MTKDMPKDLLDELTALYQTGTRLPGDITGRELAERLGVSMHTAQRILGKEVAEGRVERVRVMPGKGGSQWVYRRLKPKGNK